MFPAVPQWYLHFGNTNAIVVLPMRQISACALVHSNVQVYEAFLAATVR